MAVKTDPVRTIPTKNSNFEEWIAWHKALKQNFGKKQANILWVKAWSLRGSSSANTNDLRQYLEKSKIKIDNSAWDKIVDSGVDITDALGDWFKVGKFAGYAILFIVIGGAGMIVYNVARQPIKAAAAAASLRTGGLK
jgi:hypothetical protein